MSVKTLRGVLGIVSAAVVVTLAIGVGASVLRPSGRTASAHQRSAATSARATTQSGVAVEGFPAVGVTFAEPLAAARPAVSQDDAIQLVRADGLRPDVQDVVKPTAALRLFTNTLLGQTDGPDPVHPKYANVLVWDVVFPDSPQEVHGPGTLDRSKLNPPPCDLHVIVDATTGEIIEGFQSGCSLGPVG